MRFNHSTYILLLFTLFITVCTSCIHKKIHTVNVLPAGTVPDSISFIVLGDWGKRGNIVQRRVARSMNVAARKHNVQMIVTTGDNFYYNGVRHTKDPHWKQSFERSYTAPGHQVVWHPVLGNHDYRGNPQAQIDYSNLSSRWNMPARYYKVQKPIAGSNGVLFLFTDTSPFLHHYHAANMSDLKLQDTAKQTAWLKESLTTSTANWKIVVGHHPVYTAGYRGNVPELVNGFRPLFLQTATDFYISGHDHSLQYLAAPGERLTYLVSGGGSESTDVLPHPYGQFTRSSAGFIVVTLYAAKAVFYFYNSKAQLLYHKEIIKPLV